MDIFQVIVLSVIEGLTEFLPVSSTGHMILVSSIMGQHGEAEKLFEVVIQLGAILSVVSLYWSRLRSLTSKGNILKSSTSLPYTVIDLMAASLPPMLIGFLFYKKIKALLFAPIPVAISLIVGGLWLIYIERKKEGVAEAEDERIGIYRAFIIGCFQVLSLWPGFSRSGSCIIGGRTIGLSRKLSTEFSFIVSIPLMGVAVLYDIYKSINNDFIFEGSFFVLGFILAYLSALLAVKSFIGFVSKNSLVPFGIYRIILGALVLLYFY